jgi:hypothetical protein
VKIYTLESDDLGTLHVTAHSRGHAEAQARALKQQLRFRRVRAQVQVGPRLYALGADAKRKAGLEVWP